MFDRMLLKLLACDDMHMCQARATHICLDCGYIYTLQKPFEEQASFLLLLFLFIGGWMNNIGGSGGGGAGG